MDIILKKGVPDELSNKLYDLYRPFLNDIYKKSKIHDTIYLKNKSIGMVSIFKNTRGKNFVQIALLPEFRGKKYNKKILNQLISKYKLKNVFLDH